MSDDKTKDVVGAEPQQAAPTVDTVTNTTTSDAKIPSEPAPTSSAAASTKSATRKPDPIKIDNSKPEDFDGEVNTSSKLPTAEDLKKVEDYYVLDRNGKTHRFKELYSGKNVARRVLVIFIRHFFCGVRILQSGLYKV